MFVKSQSLFLFAWQKLPFAIVDKEAGGKKGMKLFLELDYFKKLNVGFALDEGMVNSYSEG